MIPSSRPASNLASTQVAAPRPQTQVEAFLKEIAGSLHNLDAALERLEPKLISVIRPLDPTGGEAASPEEFLVPTAHSLRNFNRLIVSATERINSITDRVEA